MTDVTEEMIDRAAGRLLAAVDQTREELVDVDVQERVVQMAVFRLAVQALGGRDALARAARVCGEERP